MFNTLNGSQKKCLEDAIVEGTVAIAHDDDLRLVEEMVSPSQNAEIDIPKVNHNARS